MTTSETTKSIPSLTIRINVNFAGLCNQLFALVHGILEAKRRRVSILRVGPFLTGIGTSGKILASKVFDFDAMSTSLQIKLEDDPAGRGKFTFGWYHGKGIVESEFVACLKKIRFNRVFLDISSAYVQKNPTLKECSCICHLRIEEDGIKHWSRMNKMTEKQFQQELHKRYIELFQQLVPNGSRCLVLTGSTSDPFLNVLRKVGDYILITIDPRQELRLLTSASADARELCAIVDLLVGLETKSSVFIGCHNLLLRRGSTFSYTLMKLGDFHRIGLVDLDAIKK